MGFPREDQGHEPELEPGEEQGVREALGHMHVERGVHLHEPEV